MDIDYDKMSKPELIEYTKKIINQRAVSYEDRMKLAFLDEAPFTIWACDISRKIKLWEGQCEIVYNRKKEQVLGKDFVEEFVATYEKEDAIEDCENIISSGQHMHNLAEDKDCFGHKIFTLYTHCFRIHDVETGEPLQAEMAVRINVEDELTRFERIKERGKILDSANKEKAKLDSLCDRLLVKLNKSSASDLKTQNKMSSLKSSLEEQKDNLDEVFSQLLIDTKDCETSENCRLKYDETQTTITKLRNNIEDIKLQVNNLSISKMETSNNRFRIALSFPGESRMLIEKIADNLSNHFSKDEILYDNYHSAEFARPNLDIHLQKLYHDESDLIVVCLCEKYNTKEWCGLEWRAIRDLLNKKNNDSIMFLRTDKGAVDGVFGTIDGYLEVTKHNIKKVAEDIIKRHGSL